MKIATVVLKFRENDNLEECLNSLRKSRLGGIIHKIIVIDNSRENLGFSGGNNKGIEEALEWGAEAVMLLNDDTKIDEEAINRLKKVLFSDRKIGLVVPKIYFYPGFEYHKDRYQKAELGKIIWYAGGRIDWDNILGIHSGVDEVDGGQFDKVSEIDFATGCCFMVKRKILEKVGLFDERYFLYLEDMDLSVRIKEKGYKLVYEPKAVVWHKNAGSSGSGSDLHDYFFTRNRLLFGMKHASFRTKFALIRESGRIFFRDNKWRRQGVVDFYLRRWGKGSWPSFAPTSLELRGASEGKR